MTPMLHRLAFLLLLWILPQAVSGARPNVLFIAIDDLANALGCQGAPGAHTPHMDRLAGEGVRFDRAYNQIPLCNPSRASVLTGRRPDTTQVYDLERHFRETLPDGVTLPQLFHQNGWFTARVGKIYHYDVPKGIGTNGLDDAPSWQLVINPRGRDVTDEALITNPTPQKPVSAALSWLAADGGDEEQTDGMVATEAIRLMEQHRDDPFFLGVGFFRPHTPFVAPKRYFDLHPLESIHLPETPADDRQDIPVAAFAHNNPTPHYGLDELTCRKALQAYRASVSFVDAQVGRLLEALDRLGLAQQTLVVLWSDHGYHLGEHGGVWQKRTLFEESARAPLIIRAPGQAGNGRACTRVVEFVDIYPTLADLASIRPPKGLDGRSLRPLLADPEHEWDGAAITQILRPADSRLQEPVMGRSIRTGRWRFTEWNGGKAGLELYDHQHDPQEFHNLALQPNQEAAEAMKMLRLRLNQAARALPPATPVDPKRL
jgi:iduronate 2-sulfatase